MARTAVQVDHYRLDRELAHSFVVDGDRLYSTLCRLAGRRIEALQAFVLGQVAVVRVDLGRAGYAVLEHVA